MKSIEELKKEQHDAKAKLHELIETINSEEYFSLSPKEKGLISQQRAGMEVYLNALTNRVYSKEEYSFDPSSAMWPLLMSSMFTNSSSWGVSSNLDSLKKQVDEETHDEPVYAVPV
jgi:hypothetical protein